MLHFQPWSSVRSLPMAEHWNQRIFKVPSDPSHSILLCFQALEDVEQFNSAELFALWWCSPSVSRAEVMLLQALCRDSPCFVLPVSKEGGRRKRDQEGKIICTSCSIYLIYILNIYLMYILSALNQCSQRGTGTRGCTDIGMITNTTFGCSCQNSLQIISLWFSILQLAKVL